MKTRNIEISYSLRMAVCIGLTVFTVIATLAFALGGISIYGKSITVFSAIDMSLEIFEITFDTAYTSLMMTSLGILYIFFLIQFIIKSVHVIKYVMSVFDNKTDSGHLKLKTNLMLGEYFAIIAQIFLYVLIASFLEVNNITVLTQFLIYCGIGMYFIFYAIDYLANNKEKSISEKLYTLCGTVIGIFCVIIMSRIIDTPIVKSIFNSLNAPLIWPQNLKGIIYILYYVYVEPILIMIILNYFRRLLFSIDDMNDSEYKAYAFANSWKVVMIISIIMIIARGVINIYLYDDITSMEDTVAIMSQWFKYIRSDALPLLLISIGARYSVLNYANTIKEKTTALEVVPENQ